MADVSARPNHARLLAGVVIVVLCAVGTAIGAVVLAASKDSGEAFIVAAAAGGAAAFLAYVLSRSRPVWFRPSTSPKMNVGIVVGAVLAVPLANAGYPFDVAFLAVSAGVLGVLVSIGLRRNVFGAGGSWRG